MSNIIASPGPSECKLDDFFKFGFHRLATSSRKVFISGLSYSLHTAWERWYSTVIEMTRFIKTAPLGKGRVKSRKVEFQLLPCRESTADRRKEDLLRLIALLWKGRSVPRISHA